MRKLYFLILVALISSQADAQSFLKFTQTQYTKVIAQGDTTVLVDTVYNTSSNSYSGTLRFGLRVLDSVITGAIPDSFDFSGSPLDTNGTTGSKRRIDIHIPYNNFLIGGPTGVVIWPLYTGGHAGPDDTIRLSLTVTPTGLEEAPLSRIYLTQQDKMLNIHFGDYQDIIQQVSLYNIEGRQMFSGSADSAKSIYSGSWSSGLYFCEIKTHKGERRTIRFILQ